MSHHYETDRSCLNALLRVPLRYLGLMGPRKRAETMLHEFREAGMLLDKAALQNFHNPVGLDIGTETPAQIALAILSEIQAVLSDHSAGFLRKKQGPVHARSAGMTEQVIATALESQAEASAKTPGRPRPSDGRFSGSNADRRSSVAERTRSAIKKNIFGRQWNMFG